MRLLAAIVTAIAAHAADPLDATVARIASVQEALPWVWSPAAEGLADIPFTYQVHLTRSLLSRAGREVRPSSGPGRLSGWRDLEFERIPLDWGAFLRCLSENGKSPCSDEWNRELERQVKNRDDLTPEQRVRLHGEREQRRQRRRAFWREFPSAFQFQRVGENQLRFTPIRGFRPQHSVADGMLTSVQGQLWFDPSTHEIIRLEYEMTRDVNEPFLRLPKGTRFETVLTRSAEGRYLPERVFVRRPAARNELIEDTTVYSAFRRFQADSKIQFDDSVQ